MSQKMNVSPERRALIVNDKDFAFEHFTNTLGLSLLVVTENPVSMVRVRNGEKVFWIYPKEYCIDPE